MIHEIVLLPLETPKREHSIEACALVAHRDQGALAGQHNLQGHCLGGIALVAVLVGIAESVLQRHKQVPRQFRPRHIREPFHEHDFQEREKIPLGAAMNTCSDIRSGEAWVSDIAQKFARRARRLDLREKLCPVAAQVDHNPICLR